LTHSVKYYLKSIVIDLLGFVNVMALGDTEQEIAASLMAENRREQADLGV
jgi:hypothetical protein